MDLIFWAVVGFPVLLLFCAVLGGMQWVTAKLTGRRLECVQYGCRPKRGYHDRKCAIGISDREARIQRGTSMIWERVRTLTPDELDMLAYALHPARAHYTDSPPSGLDSTMIHDIMGDPFPVEDVPQREYHEAARITSREQRRQP